MKKIISLFVVFILLFTFAGCNAGSDDTGDTGDNGNTGDIGDTDDGGDIDDNVDDVGLLNMGMNISAKCHCGADY